MNLLGALYGAPARLYIYTCPWRKQNVHTGQMDHPFAYGNFFSGQRRRRCQANASAYLPDVGRNCLRYESVRSCDKLT